MVSTVRVLEEFTHITEQTLGWQNYASTVVYEH